MIRQRKVFEIGDCVAGARVLDKWIGAESRYPARRWRYRIECMNCGYQRVVGHSALVERLYAFSLYCRACQGIRREADTEKKAALNIALSGAWR